MLEDLKLCYRIVLVKLSQNLTEEEIKELLFYSKDSIPKRLSSIHPTGVQIFDRLEDADVISWENLNFVTKFSREVNRQDLVKQLTSFEITRELVMYALKRQGSQPSMTSSTESVGLHLAEMLDTLQDRLDFPTQGLIESLLESRKNVVRVLEMVFRRALPSADETKPNAVAILVAIAAEIVLLVLDENQQENRKELAMDVAIELANYLFFKVAKVGGWKNFCLYVEERHSVHFSKPVVESAPDFSWQLALTDLVGKMKERFFNI